MAEDWFQTLLAGKVDVDLPELRLSCGKFGDFRGSGRIEWQAGNGIRLRAATDNAAPVVDSLLFPNQERGNLVPEDEFVTASGRTQNGDDVTTSAEWYRGCKAHADSPHLLWDHRLGWYCRRHLEEFALVDRRVIRVLLSLSVSIFPRQTSTRVSNDIFGGTSYEQDWMLTDVSFGRVAVRRRTSEWAEVRILCDSPPPTDSADRLVAAAAWALGFIFGKRCLVRGYEDRTPEAVVW